MSFQEKKNTICLLELDGFLWEIPLEDYSFSQELTQSQVDRNEMAINGQTGYVNRSAQLENTNLGPVNWSITTPIRPFISSASGTGRADTISGTHHAMEEPLWSMIATTTAHSDKAYAPVTSPTFLKSSWSRADLDSTAGGTGSSNVQVWERGNNGFQFRFFPFTTWGQYFTSDIDYGHDYEFTFSFGTGGSATPILVIENHSWTWDGFQDTVDNVTKVPTIFIRSIVAPPNYHDQLLNQTNFDCILTLPSTGDNLGTIIGSKGNFTISAALRSSTGFANRRKLIDQQSEWNFHNSQGSELISGNFYFITNSPVASVLPGLAGSANALILDVPTIWSNFDWAVQERANDINYFYKKDYMVDVDPDYAFYDTREIPGINLGWDNAPKISGTTYWHEDQNGNFPSWRSNMIKQAIIGGVTYTVTNNEYEISGTKYKAPILRMKVRTSLGGTTGSNVGECYLMGGEGGNPGRFAIGANIKHGDVFVIDGNTTDYYGNTLGADVRIVVNEMSSNSTNSRTMLVLGATNKLLTDQVTKGQWKVFGGENNPDWINENDFKVEFIDTGTNTTYTLTESALSNTEILHTTTATTHGSAITGSASVTITEANSNINVGDLVRGDDIRHTYFVVGNSGTTVTLHTAIDLPASSRLIFTRTPTDAGMNAGEYRWYHSSYNTNQLIIRMPQAQVDSHNSGVFSANSDVDRIKVFVSKKRHSGGSSVYKLKDCVIDTATVDVDINSTAKITWTGYGTEIEEEASNVTLTTSAPTTPAPVAGDIYYDIDDRHAKIRNAANTAWVDAVDEGRDSTTNFISNKLSTLKLTDLQDSAVHQTVTVPLSQTTGNFKELAYNYESHISGSYYSSLKSGPGSGFAANVAFLAWTVEDDWLEQVMPSQGVTWRNDTLLPNSPSANGVQYWNKWVEDYDWALTIDGTTYGSGFYLGTESWNVNGPLFLQLKTETTFGKFVIQRAGTDLNVYTLLICTAESGQYNTLSELNAAKISLVGTAKTSTPTRQSFDIPITSANITIANNIQMITKNELGKINRVTGHQLGQRSITGTYSAYLCDDVHLLRGLAKDNIDGYTSTSNAENLNIPLYPYSFDGVLTLGGAEGGDNTVTFQTPVTGINLPSIETEDVFSTNIPFTALDKFNIQKNALVYAGPNADTDFPRNIGDEIRVKYKGK